MNNIFKINIFLLAIIIVSSTTHLTAMHEQSNLYFRDSTKIITLLPDGKEYIKGMQFIEKQIQQGHGFAKNNPIRLPSDMYYSDFWKIAALNYDINTLNNKLNNYNDPGLRNLISIAQKLENYFLVEKIQMKINEERKPGNREKKEILWKTF